MVNKKPILEVQSLSVQYGGVQALTDVSLSFGTEQIVAIMGPNGAGKSTVLKGIFGLAPVQKGKIVWRGESVTPTPHLMVSEGISFVPQGRRVFTHLTVEENLEIGGMSMRDKKEIRRHIEESMKFFPILLQKRRAKAGTLSGGQQQMLALARGLMAHPKILLLDEPTLGLSPRFVKEVFSKVREIRDTFHTTIVVVEHNVKSLLAIVDYAYILAEGSVVAEGDVKKLEKEKILEKVMLGTLTR